MAKQKRDENPDNMYVGFYMKATICSILSNTKNKHLLSLNKKTFLFQEQQARMLEQKLSRASSGKLGVSCPTGARRTFFRQKSRIKVLTAAATQNVALASLSNNHFASSDYEPQACNQQRRDNLKWSPSAFYCSYQSVADETKATFIWPKHSKDTDIKNVWEQ